jgi:hypothetical protein
MGFELQMVQPVKCLLYWLRHLGFTAVLVLEDKPYAILQYVLQSGTVTKSLQSEGIVPSEKLIIALLLNKVPALYKIR